ncbi:MAG: DoxX family membrane protein [Ferruginibacter sp.]
MKALVNISRILVGVLFIFSGLVKAIDPRGLAYKMGEFFDAWRESGILPGLMDWLNSHALLFSVVMISLEVILGVLLLLGEWKKMTAWLLLVLMAFFTFLTSYVLFSGKIRACGCFGDCIPLTPIQTFTKDIILLVLVLLILFFNRHIQPVFPAKFRLGIFVLAFIGVAGLQWYVLRHLPVKDCLPYKPGNNILELRKMPKDAVPDKFSYTFIYEKGGVKKEFGMDALPDSSWTYVDRKQVLVEKGRNNVPLINDFSFTTSSGNDTTEAILGQPGNYYLLFVNSKFPGDEEWSATTAFMALRNKNLPLYVITSQPAEVDILFNKGREPMQVPVFSCDMTAIKTAARNNPVLFLMKGPVIQRKWSWADFSSIKN